MKYFITNTIKIIDENGIMIYKELISYLATHNKNNYIHYLMTNKKYRDTILIYLDMKMKHLQHKRYICEV